MYVRRTHLSNQTPLSQSPASSSGSSGSSLSVPEDTGHFAWRPAAPKRSYMAVPTQENSGPRFNYAAPTQTRPYVQAPARAPAKLQRPHFAAPLQLQRMAPPARPHNSAANASTPSNGVPGLQRKAVPAPPASRFPVTAFAPPPPPGQQRRTQPTQTQPAPLPYVAPAYTYGPRLTVPAVQQRERLAPPPVQHPYVPFAPPPPAWMRAEQRSTAALPMRSVAPQVRSVVPQQVRSVAPQAKRQLSPRDQLRKEALLLVARGDEWVGQCYDKPGMRLDVAGPWYKQAQKLFKKADDTRWADISKEKLKNTRR